MCEVYKLYILPLLLESNEWILTFIPFLCIRHVGYSLELKTSVHLSQNVCEHLLCLFPQSIWYYISGDHIISMTPVAVF